MAPARRKRAAAAAAASAAAAAAQWKVGDLVLAKMKGFPAWPAMISEPEQWGLSSVKKKLLVYFYGTKQIAFCNYADLEAFTEEKKKSLLVKRQGKGADFVRAVDEIIDIYESLKKDSNNKLNLAADEVKPDVENVVNNISSIDNEGPENSSTLGNDKKLECHSVTAKGHDMVNSDEPSIAVRQTERCVVNSAPDEPIENVSILDELRHAPLGTSSFSRKKRQRDSQPQNCYTRSRFPSLRRSRSTLSVEPRKVQDSAKLLSGTSLKTVDLVPNDQLEDSAQNKCIQDDKPSSSSPSATPDDVWLHSSGGTFNQPGTPGTSNDDKNLTSTTKVQSTCNSEVSQNGALEKEFKLNGTSDLTMNTTVIFKRKRKPNRKRVNCSTDCTAPMDEELHAELSCSLADSPNSRNEVNKSDGDEHLPLVKRARVRMGRPQLDSPVHVIDVYSNRSGLAAHADQCNKHSIPTISGKDHSADQMLPVVDNNASKYSSKLDLSVPAGEGHSAWKNKEYHPKVLTLDVEAALPPSKRLHRALEAMSANAAETSSNIPEATGSKESILNCCVASLSNFPSKESINAVVTSPDRSAVIRSPKASFNTHLLHSQTGKKHTSDSVLPNNSVPASAPISSEAKHEDTHILTKDNACEEAQMNRKNPDCSFVCNKVDTDVHGKAPAHSMKLNEHALDVTQTISEPDQLSSSLEKANENEVTKPIGCSAYDVDKSVDKSTKPVSQVKVHVSENNGICNSIPHGETVLAESAINVGDTASTSSLATKSSSIHSDADTRAFEMHTFSALALKELNQRINLKDKSVSPDSMPMKELIAAAQARRFSRSTSFSDNFLDSKCIPESLVNTPIKEGSHRQSSPSNRIIRSASTSDRVHTLQNSGRSPFDSLQQKGLNKLAGHDEAHAARRSFEAFLGTLTRTKECIARATRLAIECAKHGIAGEAIDNIIERLEKETNLYKRVDLFFLVDSITQSSRNQKGGAGDVYPSLIQAVLPRLLYAAAPPGNSAWENRRQCLKVLKLWLERKTFPEYIIRHHIRELEAINEASFGSSRRPSRTERALNDPLRENEGMLVDEYGSNAGFHLPNLICTKVLEDEEGSSSEDKSFEAVTPEQEAPGIDEKEGSQMHVEKHRHILEEVDGELEMEDVAPSSEAEANSARREERTDTNCTTSDQHPSNMGPPLPDDRPPSPPPLPSSPPPMPPPPPASMAQSTQVQSTFHMTTDSVEPHSSRATYNVQSQQPHPIAEHPGSMNPCVAPMQPPPFCNSGYGGHLNQIPPPPPIAPLNTPGPHGNFSAPPAPYDGNSYHQPPTAPIPGKAYHMQPPPPPPPPVPNQFPYVPPESQQRAQPWGNNCSSYPERYQYNGHDQGHHRHDRRHHGHDRRHHFDDRPHHFDDRAHYFDDRGHYFDERGHHFDERPIRGPVHHEAADRGRFPPFAPGPPIPDHFEASPAPLHYGRPSDPPPGPCPGWSMPPRISNYSPSRHSMEPPVSHVAGAHGCWRPR